MNQPVFITGVERSGSSLITKILDICGVFKGNTSTMYENIEVRTKLASYIAQNINNGEFIPNIQQLNIPVDWRKKIDDILGQEGYKNGLWFLKGAQLAQTWPVWNYAYPNARWLIVRRRTGDIIQSCIKTGYMRIFKDEANLQAIGVGSEEEGWKWWVHQYEKAFVGMIEAGLDCKIIWPERMVRGDYQQVYETLEWLGLKWSSKIVEIIDPMLIKSRRKEQWHA